MTILVIQHSAADPIGVLGDYLQAGGARLQTGLPLEHPDLPQGDFDGLIILGGTMNACQDKEFPHLGQAVELIQRFHQAGKPVLGICLGAQLIARACGGRVYPAPVPELGFTRVYTVNGGEHDPLLRECPPELHIMQWHFDTFDLPAGAELLMSSQDCQNQCYRIGDNIYGVQFHPEITPDIVRHWCTFNTPWIEENYPSLFQDLEVQLELYWQQSAQFAEKIALAWLTHIPTRAMEQF